MHLKGCEEKEIGNAVMVHVFRGFRRESKRWSSGDYCGQSERLSKRVVVCE